MCQLTFLNVKNKAFLESYLVTQLIMNSRNIHQDGAGVFISDEKAGKIIKTELAPIECSNVAKFFGEHIIKSSKVIAHVRKASSRVSEIKAEHSHPFRQKKHNIVLAHNGTLEFKDKTRQKVIDTEFPDLIDSQIFLEVLADRYKVGKMADALVETMKLFTGKFAFLIYEGKTKKYFIVRGKATLHFAEVFLSEKNIGFVINTSKDDLEVALHITAQTWPLHKASKLTYGEIELLKEETIFELDKDGLLLNVGKIKENIAYATYYRGSAKYWKTEYPSTSPKVKTSVKKLTDGTGTPNSEITTEVLPTTAEERLTFASKKIKAFLEEFTLTIEEGDAALFTACGGTFSGIVPQDLEYLEKVLIPKYKEFITENGGMFAFRKKAKKWKEIRTVSLALNVLELYSKFPLLEFPYFFSNISLLEEVKLFYTELNKKNLKEGE